MGLRAPSGGNGWICAAQGEGGHVGERGGGELTGVRVPGRRGGIDSTSVSFEVEEG